MARIDNSKCFLFSIYFTPKLPTSFLAQCSRGHAVKCLMCVWNVANVAEDIEDSNLLPGQGFLGKCGMVDQKSQEAHNRSKNL